MKREGKGKGEKERYTHLNAEIQSIGRRDRNPYLVINAKKQRKTTEWERAEISSRKLEIPRELFSKDGHNKGQKWYGPKRSRRYNKKWQEYAELYKKIFIIQIITVL